MAVAEPESQSPRPLDGVENPATCDNVMKIFSSFQQTFNTEQDIREVNNDEHI